MSTHLEEANTHLEESVLAGHPPKAPAESGPVLSDGIRAALEAPADGLGRGRW